MTNDARLIEPLKMFARSDDADLRALGLASLHAGFIQQRDVFEFLAAEEQRTGGFGDAVRLRWSVAADILAGQRANQGDAATSILFLNRSIEANPNNYVSLSHLALAQIQAGDAEQAVLALRRAIQARPTKAALHFQLAQTLARMNRVPEAIQAVESGLRLAPEDAAARRLLEQLRRP